MTEYWTMKFEAPTPDYEYPYIRLRCGAENSEDDHWEITGILSEKYARLIEAAPDLLAAIKNSDDAHWTPAMRAAMKKALGEDRPMPSTDGTK